MLQQNCTPSPSYRINLCVSLIATADAERDHGSPPDGAGDPAVRLRHGPRLPHADGEPGELLRDQLVHARDQGADADRHTAGSLRAVS